MFDPGLAFEEVLSRRLSSLYSFALFLAGDLEDKAETLLYTAVGRAFDAHLAGEAPTVALDRELLSAAVPPESWLAQPPDRGPSRFSAGDRVRISTMDPATMRRAAVRIPAAARAVIWFVVVERLTYAETARVLEADIATVASMLRWRDPLIRHALELPDSGGLQRTLRAT